MLPLPEKIGTHIINLSSKGRLVSLRRRAIMGSPLVSVAAGETFDNSSSWIELGKRESIC